MFNRQLNIRLVFGAFALSGIILLAAYLIGAFSDDATTDKAFAEDVTDQYPLDLGTYTDWGVHKYVEGPCFIMSEPKTTDPMVLEGKRRVNIMVMVGREVDPLAVEPDPVLFEMVLVQSGYRFDDKSTVRVMLGEAQHELITGGFEAGTRLEEDWAAREKAARAILEQMRRHDVMVVEGVSETGIRSTDRYSLLGFSKAYQAMVRECPG